MLGSKKFAFQKFGYTDPTITTENITISQQRQLPYKPPQEPNTYGFGDDMSAVNTELWDVNILI